MNILLTPLETRVIASLIEKAITTPDQYPLSLNALTAACNQKNNREPVLTLSQEAVQETLDSLLKKHLILEKSGFGSRVPKYQHRFCNTGFGSLDFNPVQTALLCELMLRGPQTPGELRTRAARMAPIADLTTAEQALQALASREDGPFVVQLPREPGRRDSRYAHLFNGDIDLATLPTSPPEQLAAPLAGESATTDLQARVAALEAEVAALKSALGLN